MEQQIDLSKLSRDYSKEPLVFGERIPASDLQYLYITLNLSLEEIAKYFKSSTYRIKVNLRRNNIKKSMEAHEAVRRRNCLKKYGVEKFGQCKEFIEKRKNTNLEKYGFTCSLNNAEVRKKAKQTCFKHYGVETPFESKEILEKTRDTLYRNYGVRVPTKSKVIIEKSRETSKARYGVENQRQAHYLHKEILLDDTKLTDFIKNTNKKWTTAELSVYFNISVSAINIRLKELDLQQYIDSNASAEEAEVAEYLKQNGISFRKFRKDRKELDIYIPSKDIAIEFNGNYWHSTDKRPDTKYHINKSKFAKENGIFLYHIFEYDWENKRDLVIGQLQNLLNLNTNKLYARNGVIKEVPSKEAAKFLIANHLQGNAVSKVNLGLYINNVLVSIMTFGKPRFNKEHTWELVRFCNKMGTSVVGGASKLFKHFVQTYNPSSIISYSDIAHTRGKLYSVLGFNEIAETVPNYVWVNHGFVLSRYQCQKHKLIAGGFGSLGTTEDSIMKARGFVKVYDCGNRIHIWRQ